MAELHITLSDGRQVRFKLGNQQQTIGRDATCEIAIDDPSASRRHARFTPTAKGYVVEDLGSKNGTLVNDASCRSAELRDGDRIALGAAVAVFHEDVARSQGGVVISDLNASESHATRYVSREKELMLSQRRLQMIYELSERLTTLQGRDILLENAMDICFETLQFERGAIGLRQRQGRGVDWPVVRNLRGSEGELTISRSLFSRALEHGERAIFTDIGSGSADPTVSMVQHGIRSAMCVPLLDRDGTLGVVYGDRISTSTRYAEEDIDFLAAIARQVTIGLINCRLMEDQEQMIRLNRDLDLARNIQTALFPAKLPQSDSLKVAALNEPGQRISGDYYDVIERPDGRCWCLIADVTGEGIAAALLMANLQAAVRVTIDETDDPGVLLTRWNKLICRNTTASKFITCVLALIDPANRRVRFANAGHCPPLLVRASTAPTEAPVESHYPLGIDENADYQSGEIELGAEPVVFFCYTDGVIEAMNTDGEHFELSRLIEAFGPRTDLNPTALVKNVRKSVTSHVGSARQSDDITMLAVRVG